MLATILCRVAVTTPVIAALIHVADEGQPPLSPAQRLMLALFCAVVIAAIGTLGEALAWT